MTLDMKHATGYVSTLDLSQPRRTVAVVGGTNGLGEGVVLRLGSLGCRVIILGRDEVNAGKIKEELKTMKPHGDVADISFVKCDLMTIAGMKDAVAKLSKQAGPKGLDSVILSQHGILSGEIKLTTDGHEQGYAIQCLSRFVIAHQVASLGLLKPSGTVVFVAVTGLDLKDMSVDDLSLIERSKTTGKRRLFWEQTLRNHSVLDSVTIELNKRFPKYQFHNVCPTIIITPTYPWDKVIFPFNWIAWALSFVIGSTREVFAPLPIYVALCDQKEREKKLQDNRMWSQFEKNIVANPGSWASNADNREALWNKLCESL